MTHWPKLLMTRRSPARVGWCVGARPQRRAALAEPINALERWLDTLAARGFDCVAGWRSEQEYQLRTSLLAAGERLDATLDDAGVDRFVLHYQRITQHILAEMPGRADMTICLDEHRPPVARHLEIS